MNEHQLRCFVAVSRTLNFSAAAREIFCTQPALSYQIRNLEKELDAELFQRSTTQVVLTDAGRALLPVAEELCSKMLEGRLAVRAFSQQRRITLRLPAVLLRRDPIYPELMARLHAAFPDYELHVDTSPVVGSLHHMLCTEADAAVYLPFTPLQPEVCAIPLLHNACYIAAAPGHKLAGRSSLTVADIAGQHVYYEPLYAEMVDFICRQPDRTFSTAQWTEVENYENIYANLLSGRALCISPIKYNYFPESWYIPMRLTTPLPDTYLVTVRDDTRPEIQRLKELFGDIYSEYFGRTT